MNNLRKLTKKTALSALLLAGFLQVSDAAADNFVLTGAIDTVVSNPKTGITTTTPVTLELQWTLDPDAIFSFA